MESFSPRPSRPATMTERSESAPRPSPPRSEARLETKSDRKKRSSKGWIISLIGLLLVAAALYWAWTTFLAPNPIKSDKYQVVQLSNGEHYFGKLSSLDGDYYRLTEIYYMQNQQKTADDGTQSTEPVLIKRGSENHGPEDFMYIRKDQVIYFENLKDDGKVVSAIKRETNK